MAYQFQPIGPAKTEGIGGVLTPKLQPAPKLQTGTPIRPKEEPDTDKVLMGLGLGSLAPFLADLGVKGLSKIPGLEKFLYQEDPTLKAIKEADTAAKAVKELPSVKDTGVGYSEQELRDHARNKRMAEIRSLLPDLSIDQRKSVAGNLLSSLLTVGAGVPLKDPDAVDAFTSGVSGTRKFLDAQEKTGIDAAISRAEARNRAVAQIDPTLTTVNLYGFQKQEGTGIVQGYRTQGLRDQYGVTWTKSRGSSVDIDPHKPKNKDGSSNIIPAGQYYINEKNNLVEGEPADIATQTYQDTKGGDLHEGHDRKYVDPDTGAESFQTVFIDPEDSTKYVTRAELQQRGYNLVSSPDLYRLREIPGSEDKELIKEYTKDRENRAALFSMNRVAQEVMRPLMGNVQRVENPDGSTELIGFSDDVTTLSSRTLAQMADSVGRNIKEFGNQLADIGYGSGQIDSFNQYMKGRLTATRSYSANALLDSVDQYEQLLAIPESERSQQDKDDLIRARRLLGDTLLGLRDSAVNQAVEGDDIESGWFGADKTRIDDYLAKTGLYGANQIRLAYMAAAAAGQTGRTLSDKDVAFFMRQMGFEDGNARVASEKVANFVFQQNTGYDGDNDRGVKVRRLNALEGASEDFINKELFDLNSSLAGEFRIPMDLLDDLRSETDPEEREALRQEIKQKYIDRNTRGLGGALWILDERYNVFKPFTFAEEFVRDKEYLGELQNYLKLFGYDVLRDTRVTSPRATKTESTAKQDRRAAINKTRQSDR